MDSNEIRATLEHELPGERAGIKCQSMRVIVKQGMDIWMTG